MRELGPLEQQWVLNYISRGLERLGGDEMSRTAMLRAQPTL
jgi:hypothetical protein